MYLPTFTIKKTSGVGIYHTWMVLGNEITTKITSGVQPGSAAVARGEVGTELPRATDRGAKKSTWSQVKDMKQSDICVRKSVSMICVYCVVWNHTILIYTVCLLFFGSVRGSHPLSPMFKLVVIVVEVGSISRLQRSQSVFSENKHQSVLVMRIVAAL